MEISFEEAKSIIKSHIDESLVYSLWSDKPFPIVVERQIVKELLNPSLPVGYILGDWGQGKTTAGLSAVAKIKNAQNLQVTYISMEILSKRLSSDADFRSKVLQKFFSKKGIKHQETLQGYPDRLLKNVLLFIIVAILYPHELANIYGLKTENISGLKSTFSVTLPIDLLKKRTIDEVLVELNKILEERAIRYIVMIDEIEGLEDFPAHTEVFKRAITELIYSMRVVYDLHGNKTNINIIFLVPSYYMQFIESIKSSFREERARALGIFAKFGEIPPMNEEELKIYLQKLIRYLGLPPTFIKQEAIKYLIRQIINLSERTRGRIAYLNNILLDMIMHIYSQVTNRNYINSPSRDVLDILDTITKELNDKAVTIDSKILTEIFGEFDIESVIKQVARDKTKQIMLLEAIREYFIEKLSRYRIQVWTGKRSRGYICDGLKLSDGRREYYYVLWVRFTPIYTPLDEQKLLVKLGVAVKKKGKIIKPQSDVKVILIYPESLSMMPIAALKNLYGFPLKKELVFALLAMKGIGISRYGDFEYYRTLLDRELKDRIQNLIGYMR